MKKEYTGKLYKLCEDYIKHCNFKYEMSAFNLMLSEDLLEMIIKRVEDDIEETVDKIQKLLNE